MRQLPQYKKIYETLRRRISDGVYGAGDLLPSENELSLSFGASRPTVRKALKWLVDDSFIFKHQGKGSIVKGAPKGIGILSLMGTTSAMGDSDLRTVMIVEPEIRSWDEAFSFSITTEERLGGCIYFERLRLLGGIPMFFDITMLPAVYFPDFTFNGTEDGSLFETLRTRYRITIKGGIQQLFAIRPDKRLQDHFNINAGHPVLQLNRKIESSRNGVYIYSQVFCVTQGYGLSGTF